VQLKYFHFLVGGGSGSYLIIRTGLLLYPPKARSRSIGRRVPALQPIHTSHAARSSYGGAGGPPTPSAGLLGVPRDSELSYLLLNISDEFSSLFLLLKPPTMLSAQWPMCKLGEHAAQREPAASIPPSSLRTSA